MVVVKYDVTQLEPCLSISLIPLFALNLVRIVLRIYTGGYSSRHVEWRVPEYWRPSKDCSQIILGAFIVKGSYWRGLSKVLHWIGEPLNVFQGQNHNTIERFTRTYTCTWNVKGQRSPIVTSSLCFDLRDRWQVPSCTRMQLNVKLASYMYGPPEVLMDRLLNFPKQFIHQYVGNVFKKWFIFVWNIYLEYELNYSHQA